MDIKELDSEYIANTYARFPLQIVSGKGAVCFDENGKKYIDLGGGIAVNVFGYCDDEWQKAVVKQASTLSHASNLYYTEPCIMLAKTLCERTGMKKVFFSNSGAEANECAIKTARKYASDKYGDYSHSTIITLKNSFHGRTIATLTATGQDGFHKDFGPFPDGFAYASASDISEVEALAGKNNCAAIMLEVIQGEGGVCPLTKEYIEGVKKIAREKDLLIIVDEVQTGNGRTGKLYAYMNFDLQPDIVTTAKSLAGGLPLGATMFNDKTEKVLTFGSHGSTFGGNPVCCAAANSVLSRLDEPLFASVREKSEYIVSEISKCRNVESVMGMGFMLGIKPKTKTAKEIANECIENGVLVLTAKDKIRLLPPLNIPFDELKTAIKILKEVLDK